LVKLLKVVEGDVIDELTEQGRLEVQAHKLNPDGEPSCGHEFLVLVVDPMDEPVHVFHHFLSLAEAQRAACRLAVQYRNTANIIKVFEERGYWQAKGNGPALFRRFNAVG
jgi:hypothetical protein